MPATTATIATTAIKIAGALDDSTRATLQARLKSIEGQARGIGRMLDEGRECHAVLDQLAALRAASQAVGMQAFEAFALQCLRESSSAPEQVLSEFLGTVSKLTR